MRIYLDHCCYNRPFDDQAIDRNRLEAEAVLAILKHSRVRGWALVRSEVHDIELSFLDDRQRGDLVESIMKHAEEWVAIDSGAEDRARVLVGLGFAPVDALHIACAEHGRCDVLLTTDDAMIRRASRHSAELSIEVAEPVNWLMERNGDASTE